MIKEHAAGCTSGCDADEILAALGLGDDEPDSESEDGAEAAATLEAVRIVTLAEFCSVEEPGAEPLVGTPEANLIAEGSDVMLYGDGGAGKTTLAVDGACHLAAGDAWLGVTVRKRSRVLIVENEGPRPPFRAKLRRKLAGWKGSELGDRVSVWEAPWARLRLDQHGGAQALADAITERDVDVVVIGPLVASGMIGPGTLYEVRALHRPARARPRARRSTRDVPRRASRERRRARLRRVERRRRHADTRPRPRTRPHRRPDRKGALVEQAPRRHARARLGRRRRVRGQGQAERGDHGAEQIVAYVSEHPGTGWGAVEDATPGISRQARNALRDTLLRDGALVNLTKHGEQLDHLEERTPARLYVTGDPAIPNALPDPGAGGEQTAPAWGAGRSDPSAPCSPPYRGAGAAGADAHPVDSHPGSPETFLEALADELERPVEEQPEEQPEEPLEPPSMYGPGAPS